MRYDRQSDTVVVSLNHDYMNNDLRIFPHYICLLNVPGVECKTQFLPSLVVSSQVDNCTLCFGNLSTPNNS